MSGRPGIAAAPLAGDDLRGAAASRRIHGIDWLRGIAMVLMALDHVRDYFGDIRIDPSNLAVATPALFFTRWVTHFCAPIFVLLAGTGAYLYGARGRSRAALSWFLLSRGLWLVALEFTVVHVGWWGNYDGPFWLLQVIAAIGVAMLALAGLVWLPMPAIAATGLVVVGGHNLLDAVTPADLGALDWLWVLLHEGSMTAGFRPLPLGAGQQLLVLYPLLPWIGVMALGYALGPLFLRERAARRRALLLLGVGATALFVVLRASGAYGSHADWQAQGEVVRTLMAFLNCQKYPPSLCYLLMTLGPALIALALLDRPLGRLGGALVVFGRVPLFYYVVHLYVAQFGSQLVYLLVDGEALQTLPRAFSRSPFPSWYGHELPVVYAAWVAIVLLLYLPCRWFAGLKQRSRSRWLSYL